MKCNMYEKHHNIINGIYLDRNPKTWKSISIIDSIDADDDEGELYALLQDAVIYDIEDLDNFTKPTDIHNIKETIFVILVNGSYYLCETQGELYIKYSINISNFSFITKIDRMQKLKKIYEKSKL